MNINIHENRVLIEPIVKEVENIKDKEDKFLIGLPDSVNEDNFAKKIMENTGAAIPTGEEEDYLKWKVLKVGEDVKHYKPDDVVLCHPKSGTDFIVKGKFYKLLTEREIYGNIIQEANQD